MGGSSQNTTLDKKIITVGPLFSDKVLASFTVFYRTNTTVILIFFNHAEAYKIHFEACSTTEVVS